jgi:hypothetical protein
MNRKLKALGAALMAVLAFSAVAVSTASAWEFHGEAAHTVLTGNQVGEDVFTVNAGTVRCKSATYSGTNSVATTTTQTVSPTYKECTAFGFVSTAIDTNGCAYEFHAVGTGTPSDFTGTTTIVCSSGQPIVVTAFNCEVTVPAQHIKGGSVVFKNEGAGKTRDVLTEVNLSGIEYIQHSKSFPGCTSNETKPFTNGTYTGKATIRGLNTEGAQIGVWVD